MTTTSQSAFFTISRGTDPSTSPSCAPRPRLPTTSGWRGSYAPLLGGPPRVGGDDVLLDRANPIRGQFRHRPVHGIPCRLLAVQPLATREHLLHPPIVEAALLGVEPQGGEDASSGRLGCGGARRFRSGLRREPAWLGAGFAGDAAAGDPKREDDRERGIP
jgi:hypothetical protein